MGFIIFLHTAVCLLLTTIILLQSGRGGGLTEAFSSAESLFGAKTNIFLVRVTALLAGLFLVTCMTLAFLSSQKERSLMTDRPLTQPLSDETPAATTTHPVPEDAK